MRGWVGLTVFFTGLYAVSFLSHERPPTTGHLVAGLAILAPTLILLGAMAHRPRSRRAAIWLLVFQLMASGAAVTALFEQRLSTPLMVRVIPVLILAIPVVAVTRLLEHWSPSPEPAIGSGGWIRFQLGQISQIGLVMAGAIALMVWLRVLNFGLVLFVIVGCFYTVTLGRYLLSLSRKPGAVPPEVSTDQNEPLAS